jgi:hypothetical protein
MGATSDEPHIAAARAAPGHGLALSAWCVVAAFGAYFCMYGFRKPFTAATFADTPLGHFGYKSVLVAAQVLGYTLSKFLGIKVIAEMEPRRRVAVLLALVGAAQVALLLFGLVPPPWNFFCLFLNGLPLGMVFGLVLGFLEGRRHTEALAAGLCVSFIVADGVTRSVGQALLDAGCSEYWMPFLAGLLFVAPLLVFAWMLSRIPPPSADDVRARSARVPMSGAERRRFFRNYAAGLTLLILVYLLVTVLRSLRGDFAKEIWQGLGSIDLTEAFALSEMLVGLGVLLLGGLTVLVRDNRRAFFTALGLALAGPVLVTLALLGLSAGVLAAFPFMVLHGLGLYLPYFAVHTTVFERLIALTRDRGNIGYLMYLADAFGYLGYVAVLLTRESLAVSGDFLAFFVTISWVVAACCVPLLAACWRYFAVHPATQPRPGTAG